MYLINENVLYCLKVELADRFMDILGQVFKRKEWRIWEIDVERIVIHPRYDENGMKYLILKLSSYCFVFAIIIAWNVTYVKSVLSLFSERCRGNVHYLNENVLKSATYTCYLQYFSHHNSKIQFLPKSEAEIRP